MPADGFGGPCRHPTMPGSRALATEVEGTMTVVSPTIPEQGQLADVRQRRFVVTEVEASTLPASPLKPAQPAQHLVTLTSVEDDALGEELQVVWELEPGTRVHEALVLPEPTGFDPPD